MSRGASVNTRTSANSFVYRLNTDITTTQANVTAGIGAWVAGGGGDTPEAGLFGLQQMADTTAWRTGSQRIAVWFGDAPSHDPAGPTNVTQAQAIAALTAQGINVIAFDVGSTAGCTAANEACLDAFGQATAITGATGGSYHAGLGADPAGIIVDAIETALSTYSSVCLDSSEAPSAVTVTTSSCFTGAFDRSIDRTFDFSVDFKDNEPGVHTFPIYATVDGGRVATETDTITSLAEGVPEPGTLALVGVSLAGLGFVRRRRAA